MTGSYPGPSRRQGSKEGWSQKGRYKDQERREEGEAREIVWGCLRNTDGVVQEFEKGNCDGLVMMASSP
jgi:hypothetical protein